MDNFNNNSFYFCNSFYFWNQTIRQKTWLSFILIVLFSSIKTNMRTSWNIALTCTMTKFAELRCVNRMRVCNTYNRCSLYLLNIKCIVHWVDRVYKQMLNIDSSKSVYKPFRISLQESSFATISLLKNVHIQSQSPSNRASKQRVDESHIRFARDSDRANKSECEPLLSECIPSSRR